MTTLTLTLSEQLAAAEAAAAPLTQHVAALEAGLRTAINTHDFARAQQIQAELTTARDNHVVALAAVQALRDGAAAVDRARADDQQHIAEAQRRAQANQDLADAIAAEQNGLTELDAAIARMFEHLCAAQHELRAAVAREYSVGEARQRAAYARDAASDTPTGQPPKAPRPNKASVLAERDALVGQLARWSP